LLQFLFTQKSIRKPWNKFAMRSPNATIFIVTALMSLRERTIYDVNAETITTQENEQRLRGLSANDSPRKLILDRFKGNQVYEAALVEACPGGSTPAEEPCNGEDNNGNCPEGSECLPHPDPEGQPVCCVRDRIVPNPEIKKCVNGTEIPDLFCGKGPNRVPCPEGSYCDIDVVDRYAVCCRPAIISPFPTLAGTVFSPTPSPITSPTPSPITSATTSPTSYLTPILSTLPPTSPGTLSP